MPDRQRRRGGARREVDFTAVANVLPGLHLSVLRDVTERKTAERALRETEQRLRMVISSTPLVLFAINREGVYTLHAGKGVEAMGLRPGEAVGQSVTSRARLPS